MLVFVIAQMAFGLLFLVWLWILKARSARQAIPGRREGLLWLALISYTLGVAVDLYFMLAPRDRMGYHAKILVFASFLWAAQGLFWRYSEEEKGEL